jgi:3-dehydroquinate dehydratase II
MGGFRNNNPVNLHRNLAGSKVKHAYQCRDTSGGINIFRLAVDVNVHMCYATPIMKHTVHIVNGPNLNMLGTREPEIYGRETLADIDARCSQFGAQLGLDVQCFQSNIEGELVTYIQQSRGIASGLIINAGAYSHTSLAIMDALLTLSCPIVEVHLSNIFKREAFRHHSYMSAAARGVICGFGAESYLLALQALSQQIRNH